VDSGRRGRHSPLMLPALAPVLFVLIWSTGFIVARATVPHAAPELILLVRMALTTALLGGLAALAGERLPRGRRLVLHLVAGALLNGLYLCLSWWAVARGLPAGIMSLLGARSWAGLGVGLAGVALVLWPVVARGAGGGDGVAATGAVLAIGAMAAGTMIQRGSLAADPIRISGAVQNAAGAAVALVATLWMGDWRWDGASVLWVGLGWSVLGLSAAALMLLVWMTRHQGATLVSALLLLVPPLAALEAWLLFGERLLPVQLAGFALALGGVLLARARVRREAIAEPA
jgi:drug/metabolite transporter (DMT)-like permease